MFAGMEIDLRLVQFSKQDAKICVTELGMVIDSRLVQPTKIGYRIEMDSGSLTDDKDVQ